MSTQTPLERYTELIQMESEDIIDKAEYDKELAQITKKIEGEHQQIREIKEIIRNRSNSNWIPKARLIGIVATRPT